MRLTRTREFKAVYDNRRRIPSGPLIVWARPNGLPHHRLGLAISRRVGGAVVRNRIKRRLRECFRMIPPEPAVGYDLVIGAQRHDNGSIELYRAAIERALRKLE